MTDGYELGTAKTFDDVLFSANDLNTAVRSVPVTNVFELVPRSITQIRDIVVADGTVTDKTNTAANYDGESYVVATESGNGVNRLSFETAEIGRYRSGSVCIGGIYVQKDSAPVGTAEWGYGRDGGADELFFRYASDGSIRFVIKRNGVETIIPQSDWAAGVNKNVTDENGNVSGNVVGIDQMDGTGDSGLDYSPADGRVHRIDFSWYGGGAITPHIVGVDAKGNQRAFPIFSFEPIGQVSFTQPNQPVMARLDNEGSTTSDQLRVAGRQFSVLGNFQDAIRTTPHVTFNETLPTSPTALFLARRKSGTENAGIDINIDTLHLRPTEDALVSLVTRPTLNSTFSGSTPRRDQTGTLVDTEETAVEIDGETGITVGSGTQFGRPFMVDGGSTGQGSGDTVAGNGTRLPIPRHEPIAVVAESTSGASGSIDVTATFSESW